ncbi:hypothetical protein ABZX92_32470 [Lentzea sp. NPDC006480]|uniref:hypothetical protein n=1 Tax=Lentzea sp. NPDC006480 TaxID=3157176 RepID=UPI0033B0344B
MSTTPTPPKFIKTAAALAAVVLALLAIVTNYATQMVPPWISDNPILVWCGVGVLMAAAVWLSIRSAGQGEPAAESKKSRSFRQKRDARLLRCLACGKTILVSFRRSSTGSWECAKCGKRSTAEEDSIGRITITTPGHGAVRFVQHTQFFGMLTKTYESEVLAGADRPGVADRDQRATAEPGATVVRTSIDGMFKREFRSAFVRGLLRDRSLVIAAWSVLGAFIVPLAPPRSVLEFGGHFVVGFGLSAPFVLALFWLRGRDTFNSWLKHRDAFYCWLPRPSALALAVVMRSGDLWHVEALRTTQSRGERTLGVELMQDICRYADRKGLTLSINATHPDWLVDSLRFERTPEQPRERKYIVLTRSPQAMPVQREASRSKSKRRKGRRK